MSDHSVGFSGKPALCFSIAKVAHVTIAVFLSQVFLCHSTANRMERIPPLPPTPQPVILIEKPRPSSKLLKKMGGGRDGDKQKFFHTSPSRTSFVFTTLNETRTQNCNEVSCGPVLLLPWDISTGEPKVPEVAQMWGWKEDRAGSVELGDTGYRGRAEGGL